MTIELNKKELLVLIDALTLYSNFYYNKNKLTEESKFYSLIRKLENLSRDN